MTIFLTFKTLLTCSRSAENTLSYSWHTSCFLKISARPIGSGFILGTPPVKIGLILTAHISLKNDTSWPSLTPINFSTFSSGSRDASVSALDGVSLDFFLSTGGEVRANSIRLSCRMAAKLRQKWCCWSGLISNRSNNSQACKR